MPTRKIQYLVVMIGVITLQSMHAMVFDNRFIPLFQRPYITVDGSRSEYCTQVFATTASHSFNDMQQNIPLPEIFGKFDQAELARSIAALGNPNPLPSEFQILNRIPWQVSGKRQSQAATIFWHQKIVDWVSIGVSLLFMRVASWHEYQLDIINIEPNLTITSGDALLLDDSRRSMLKEIGIADGNVRQYGFGDIDWYLRVGNMWEYALRFRRIDTGGRLGVMIPTGVNREESKPASIPFGGNGHWGLYGEIDTLFELKEDWKVGFLLRLNKRFSKKDIRRMPVGKEPEIFGALVGNSNIDYKR